MPFGLLGDDKANQTLEDRCVLMEELQYNYPNYPNTNPCLSASFKMNCEPCAQKHSKRMAIGKWLLLGCRMLPMETWMNSCMFKPQSFETATDAIPRQVGQDLSHTCDHRSGLNIYDMTIEAVK